MSEARNDISYDDFDPAINRLFNPAAFADAGANAFGNAAPRLSDARGFGIRKEDLAIRKNMRFTEQLRMEFNVQMFNLLNRPQWGLANDNVSSSDFGKLTRRRTGKIRADGIETDCSRNGRLDAMSVFVPPVVVLPSASDLPGAEESRSLSHAIVLSQEAGRFGGWPANHGIWSWGDEIVVGFRSAQFKVMPVGHARDPEKPQDEFQARSLDGGKTWTVEKPRELVRPGKRGQRPG